MKWLLNLIIFIVSIQVLGYLAYIVIFGTAAIIAAIISTIKDKIKKRKGE